MQADTFLTHVKPPGKFALFQKRELDRLKYFLKSVDRYIESKSNGKYIVRSYFFDRCNGKTVVTKTVVKQVLNIVSIGFLPGPK